MTAWLVCALHFVGDVKSGIFEVYIEATVDYFPLEQHFVLKIFKCNRVEVLIFLITDARSKCFLLQLIFSKFCQ